MKALRAALAALLLWSQVAEAAPNIVNVTASGALADGVTLTVAGTSFGTKTFGAPLKFDNFESGTPGNDIGNGWSITTGYNAGSTGFAFKNPQYSTAVVRNNSTRSIKCSFEDQGFTTCPDFEGCQWACDYGITGDTGVTNYIPGLVLPTLYMDFWYYYAPDSPESRNVKILRVHKSASGTPNLFVNIYCYSNSDGMRVDQAVGTSAQVYNDYDDCSRHPGTSCTLDWRGSSFWAGSWRHVQLYLKQSSVGGSDGTIKLWTDGILEPNATNWNNRSASGDWNTAWIGNYMGKGSDAACPSNSYGKNHYSYSDDAYIDTTLAHVEIGDNPVYTLCTQREIQVASAWSASSITIGSARRGGFASLVGKYLFVIDRNGAIGGGYALSSGPPTCSPPF